MAAGKLGNLMAAVWAPSACLDGQTMQGRGLCRKQEGNRKCHTPVLVRSQNESVPPLVPRWDQCERLVAVELGLSARTYLEEALALSCFQLLAQ